jgi:putative hemolysin
MNILKPDDFYNSQFNRKGNDLIAKLLVQIRKLDKMNKVYSENIDKNGIEFIDSVTETLGIHFEYDNEEIKRIPADGAFITVSNHPFGGIDGLLLLKIISQVRPDFLLLANYLLHKIEPLKDFSIPFNNFETQSSENFSFTGIKKAVKHLNEQHAIGIFPAVEISKSYSMNNISDREWQKSLLKFIKNAKVPVVPVYFQGNNSWFFHMLGNMHPFLQSVR